MGSPVSSLAIRFPQLCRAALISALLLCVGLAACGHTTSPTSTSTPGSGTSTGSSGSGSTDGTAFAPSITSFAANPTTIISGASSTLSWSTSGAATISISPGSFSSQSGSGSTSVSPTTTTTYTLSATNTAGSVTSTATVTVHTGSQGNPSITTSTCPGGAQGAPYAGCTITATGGAPPYTFSVITNPK